MLKFFLKIQLKFANTERNLKFIYFFNSDKKSLESNNKENNFQHKNEI
jgi:hypothetical protein